MKLIYLVSLLALLPIISYFFQYYFAKRRKKLNLFYKYSPVIISDWVFIPFNFLLIYVTQFNLFVFLILILIIVILALIFGYYWHKIHKKEHNEISLYDLKKNKTTNEGIVHNIYAIIQAVLIGMFIFSEIKNYFVYIELFFLFVYFILGINSSISIHKKFITIDKVFVFLGLTIILIKLIYTII